MSIKTPNTAANTEDEKAVKFPIPVLRKNCVNLFGITTSTFDGATFGKTGKYSVKEMQSIIQSWGESEVK